MEKIELRILGISSTHSQTFAYALVLAEKGGPRRLPIVIGNFEAQSIAIELEKMKPSRPLTHDLFKSLSEVFNIKVKEVIIHKFEEGVFHASVICFDGVKEEAIDSRTSDAVALAIRFDAPIYTYERILNEAGITKKKKKSKSKVTKPTDTKKTGTQDKDVQEQSLKDLSLKELQKLLKKAVEEEAYERASLIRDEIQYRKDKKKK